MSSDEQVATVEVCEYCGSIDDVNDGLCDDCAVEMMYCAICKEMFYPESSCRHVRRGDEDYGCGSQQVSAEEHKASLFAVLNKAGVDFAWSLRTSLLVERYSIYEIRPVIGPGALIVQLIDREWGDVIIDNMDDEKCDAMTPGVLWLMSLEPGVTVDAELQTVEQIDEWLAEKGER